MILTGKQILTSILGSLLLLFLFASSASAQEDEKPGSLRGKVVDAETGDPLIGATVFILGTYKGAAVGLDGTFTIKDIKPGDYSVKFSFIGFTEKLFNGVTIESGGSKFLEVKMSPRTQSLDAVEIVGTQTLVNLESANTSVSIDRELLNDMNARDVQEVVAMQSGVTRTQDGLQIRGARVYETTYLIEGISAQDPLAGTGFGVDVASSSVQNLEVVTGGMGADVIDGSAGVVSTKIREGGDKFEVGGNWQRDNLGFNQDGATSFNTDIVEINMGGPVPFTNKKLKFFTNASMNITDSYFGFTADQLESSLMRTNIDPNGILPTAWAQRLNQGTFWAPRYANSFTHTLKFSYDIKPGTKVYLTNQHSLGINQNTRTLQIVGSDEILQPGFQYRNILDLDRATTYTAQTNLTVAGFKTFLNDKLSGDFTIGRLFVNNRADANGRPFRTETVDQIFTQNSIITTPIEVFNPGDDVVFLLPDPWFFNNDGINGQWHDHFVEEYTLKGVFKWYKDNIHEMTFGWEHRQQELQWVDVTAPWVGAPIKINDSLTTPSISIGASNDVWRVRPNHGGIFYSDKISYKGISATLGLTMKYWAPGKFADDAVENPNSPVIDEIREDYMEETIGLLGLRYKVRFLPRINVSFPVTENNVLFFNYSHSARLPHPLFVYASLDPTYQERAFLDDLGNPNLNPEINVSYELGIKTQLTKDLGITFSAYNNNRFDYITRRSVQSTDVTGRPVTRTMFINQDIAKVLGFEFGTQYRYAKYFRSFFNMTYQVARGFASSAREAGLAVQNTGEVPLTSEQYLAWDRPWNITLGSSFTADSTVQLFGISLNHFKAFFSINYTSGFRYTPVEQDNQLDNGRPTYRVMNERFLEERATPWWNADLKISREIPFKKGKRAGMVISMEVRNLFNNKNAQIINPVTGRAWEPGDPVTLAFRDPNYPGPFETGAIPNNPARYLAPTQILYGLAFKF